MKTKVSVILPAYNVEDYIEECLDSLLNQTLKEIEIICVDDGSTDGTLDILHQYEKRDGRVKVLQQQNQFAGVARNNGMKYATGEYIIFLDSDDFFEGTMLEKMYEEGKRVNADLVLCGGRIFDDSTKEIKPAPWYLKTQILPQELPFSYKDTNGELLNAISPAPWTKLFKRTFVEESGLQFQPFQNSNDVYFIFVAVCTSERITYVDEPFINYRKGMTTNLQSKKHLAPLCFLDAYCSAYKTLVSKGVYEYVKKGFKSSVISGCLYNYNSYDSTDVKSRNTLLEAFCEERFIELNLFSDEKTEYADWKKYCRLKGMIESYSWKKQLDETCAHIETTCLIKNNASANPKVSIIIPCYNVENYVESCVDSILQQTLSDIEVICINDGSIDATESVLLEIAKKDARVSVLTQKNAGQGTARNAGVKCAKGEYLYFMDSDDLLDSDALEYLYNTSVEKSLDVLYFDGNSFYDTEELEELKPNYDGYYIRKYDYSHCETGLDLLVEMKKYSEYRHSPCLQFIRREYFMKNDLWFLQGVWYEDNSFTFKTMVLAEKVAHINRAFFNRRVRENSVVTSSAKFIHVYGLFYNYIYMLRFTESMNFSSRHEVGVSKVLNGVLNQTLEKYHQLHDEERYKYLCLEGIEKSLFSALIIHSKLDVVELRNEKKELKAKIREQKAEINILKKSEKKKIKALKKEKKIVDKELDDLQKENTKLQKENAKLEKEIMKIKNSRTYRLASTFRKPLDVLRMIMKNIRKK